MKIKLIPAEISSVKNDPGASYYFDEALKDTNGSIYAFLIQLITNEKLKKKPDYQKIKEFNKELKKYPISPKNNFQFENKEAAELFLEPLFEIEAKYVDMLS